ncbi:MAG: deoxyribodipyrimidine photo-lyase [Bacteroidota bacterium]
MSKEKISIFWHRRDLRAHDNAGLYAALQGEYKVLPVFIFDRNILDELEDKKDRRVNFIYEELQKVKMIYQKHNSSLKVFYSKPKEAFEQLLEEYDIQAVYFNHDYEPYARERDKEIYYFLKDQNIEIHHKKDHAIFEKDEILKGDGDPYTVYTPYSKKWKDKVTDDDLSSRPSEDYLQNLFNHTSFEIPSLEEMGFKAIDYDYPDRELDMDIVKNYHNTRNIPSKNGTTKMSIHLRFGTVSIRELARKSSNKNTKYLNELIWRDFYMMILWHNPQVAEQSFRKEYDNIEWRNDEEEFERWCEGKTGYPIIDAGMRELNETGYMHNRVRMIVASFLTKHLLIDWRWGERYFAQKLLDFELSSNNGGWQWASGSGCDAAPYFRVFNPYLQTEKFDPKEKYIQKWVPEYKDESYPEPVVEHKKGRERALETYKAGLNKV